MVKNEAEMNWDALREHYSLQPLHLKHASECTALQLKQEGEWAAIQQKHALHEETTEPSTPPSPSATTRHAFEAAANAKLWEFKTKALAQQHAHELAALGEKQAFATLALAEKEAFETAALAEKHTRERSGSGAPVNGARQLQRSQEVEALRKQQLDERLALELRQKTELEAATEAVWIEHAVEDFLCKDAAM
ncbi:hypothetical protein SPRG_12178 [Saprolegnia parasitica CBS 223.65]|uniref:Uncharacterized protein n=1 Tax=Saprolegnia parasitica (strain CBS 223.65) TaxID=695850 RepID=A0A067C896_SAPPC|nr:hypothetical protein SPRG_12178 [Saprolegnia parasitica CBS 223.65]KDO22751.1 hypothetical protein SPRG_12178 [Saprolegnia parasitica CBS 223.65]|eukprot:XP_012206536.1 hypothetical protein SPRG_12178 [Saprolegnia parasitica CBS 223.65]